jgi:hypothetical protein
MTIRHMVTRAIGIAFLGALTWSPVAQAAGQGRVSNNVAPPPSGAVLKDGSLVEYCAGDGACTTSQHPIAAGPVRQIVPGDFVGAAQASWIALSNRAVNLCYLAASTAAITCTPVANASELSKGTQIAYVDLDDGTRTFRFTAKAGDKATWEANFDPYPFMTGVSAAAEVLHKHAARNRGGNANYTGPLLGGGGGADVCAFIDGGGATCTGSPGQAAREVADGSGEGGGNSAGAPGTLLVAPAAAVGAPPRQSDPNAVTTVYTAKSERPTLQACTNSVIAEMKECKDPRKKMGESARGACVANAESNLEECMAEVRYNANLNR